MQMLCSDLGIELSEEELTHAILEMDHANRTFVAYKSFEDWWRHVRAHISSHRKALCLPNPCVNSEMITPSWHSW